MPVGIAEQHGGDPCAWGQQAAVCVSPEELNPKWGGGGGFLTRSWAWHLPRHRCEPPPALVG